MENQSYTIYADHHRLAEVKKPQFTPIKGDIISIQGHMYRVTDRHYSIHSDGQTSLDIYVEDKINDYIHP